MAETANDTTRETDCSVTVYDGAWMTCDMNEEASEKSTKG